MEENIKNDICSRLYQIGHNGLNLSENKWKQLESLRVAATLMNERRKEALALAKANELTVANIERTLASLKEEGADITTITDQTMRNSDGLLERFMLTFTEKDGSYADSRKEIKRLNKEKKELEEELKLMHKRDAECMDAALRAEKAECRNKTLERDIEDAQAQINKLKKGGASAVVMGQVDLTDGGKNLN